MVLEHKHRKLQELIALLKKQSIEQKTGFWKAIALELERPSRNKRAVNLSRIEKYAKDHEIIIVPGKLLSGGSLTKKVTIIAYEYSKSVPLKLVNGSTVISIEDALIKYPTGKGIKIIG